MGSTEMLLPPNGLADDMCHASGSVGDVRQSQCHIKESESQGEKMYISNVRLNFYVSTNVV